MVQAGSIGFIPHELPIVHEIPTMVVGIKLKENVFSFVASLSKEMSSYYTECVMTKNREEFSVAFANSLTEALRAFR